jgi:hypothetical protein
MKENMYSIIRVPSIRQKSVESVSNVTVICLDYSKKKLEK